MQRLDDSKQRPDSSPVAGLSARGNTASSTTSGRESLGDVGGEPLAGSGFEHEEPEPEFGPAGEET